MTVELSGIERRFGATAALDGVSLSVGKDELLAILGPSGSGKSTLLRVIAGLETPDAGTVRFDGKDVTRLSARARDCGFVFQHYALFPHLSVRRNISFGLDVRPASRRPNDIAERVDRLLELVELPGLGERYPAQLSGGQRQRVALARALAVEPRVLLLDEPFGALDATVRRSLRRAFRRIQETAGVATVFVTHDQEEALELADRIAVINAGRIEQIGAPAEVLESPATAFVAGFVGEAVRFEGEVKAGRFTGVFGDLPAAGAPDGAAAAFVRPHDFEITPSGGLAVRAERVVVQGALARLEGAGPDGRRIEAVFPRDAASRLEGEVRLAVRQAHVFPA